MKNCHTCKKMQSSRKANNDEVEVKDQTHFGLQVHDDAQSAFETMTEEWGECGPDGFEHLTVLTDESFEKIIRARALEIFFKLDFGEIDNQTMKEILGRATCKRGKLLEFNFMLYSKKNRKFYTCINDFGDDHMNLWSDRQWDIFDELWKLYSFDSLIAEVERTLNAYRGNDKVDDWDMLTEILGDNGWLVL